MPATFHHSPATCTSNVFDNPDFVRVLPDCSLVPNYMACIPRGGGGGVPRYISDRDPQKSPIKK